MKEEINLMSPEGKRARLRFLMRKRLTYLGRRAALIWVLLWVVLGSVFWLTRERQRVVAAQLSRQTETDLGIAAEAADVNELMGAVVRWVDEHPAWTPLLAEVVQATPDEVRLEVIAVQPAAAGVLVKGVSASRAAVVEMQQRLERLPWVEKVEAPLQNFAAGPQSEFSFTVFRKNSQL